MKMSEHDTTRYDGTVRDQHKNIIQCAYGGNGLDGKHTINVPDHGTQFCDLRLLTRNMVGEGGLEQLYN
jgi:hypothetical protein